MKKRSKVKLKVRIIFEVEQFFKKRLEKVVHSARHKRNMETEFRVKNFNYNRTFLSVCDIKISSEIILMRKPKLLKILN